MITELFQALQAGKELSNAKTWKQVQLWSNNAAILLMAIIPLAASFGFKIPLDEEQIRSLVSGLAVLLGLYNSYATIATTSKLGLPSVSNSDDTGISNGAGQESVSAGWVRELDDGASGSLPVLEQEYKG